MRQSPTFSMPKTHNVHCFPIVQWIITGVRIGKQNMAGVIINIYIFNFFIAFNVFQSNEICELVYLKIFRFQFRYDLNFLNLFNFSLCHFCFPFGLLDPKNRFGDLYSNVTWWISSFFTILCNTRFRNCTMLCHSRFSLI